MANEPNNQTQPASGQKTETNRTVTVKASTKVETTGIGEGIQLRPWYFATFPGIIKLVQLLFGIICMGCGSPVVTSYTHFFMFVVASCFVFTLILCLFYLISLQELAPKVPWVFMELVFTAGACVLYLLASIVQLAMTARSDYAYSLKHFHFFDAYIAAGVFAIFNILAYGVGLMFLFRDWRQSRQVN